MSRRPFPMRCLAALLLLALMTVACTGTTDTTDGTTDTADGTTDTSSEPPPDPSGPDDIGATADRLIYGVPAPELEANNPQRDYIPSDEFQLKPLYENLIGIDPETAAWIPMLAESWEVEGNDLTFHLRQGVQFHNDIGEFTAQDVVLAYEDLIDPPGSLAPSAVAIRSTVEELEVINDYEIVFRLVETNYAFLEGLSYGAAGMAIKSKADWDSRGGDSPALEEAPIAGTGPYQFVERTPGQNVVFERVLYEHWRQDAAFEELEYRFIGENSTRLAALLAGEIHLTDIPRELGQQAVDEGMTVIQSALPGRRVGLSFLGCYPIDPINPDLPSAEVFLSDEVKFPDSPFCDIRVRQAVNKAIDRQALNDAFYAGEAEPLTLWYWLPEQTDSWNPEWEERWQEEYAYDPDGARELLAEAGYGSGGPSIQVLVVQDSGGAESADVMEAAATMVADVGFDVEIVALDGGVANETREAREFEATLEFDSTSSENVTGFEAQGYNNHQGGRAIADVEMDTMYEQVLLELDPDSQSALWREFGDVVFDAFQHVPLVRTFSEVVADPDVVCGYTFPGANMSTGYSFVEYIESC